MNRNLDNIAVGDKVIYHSWVGSWNVAHHYHVHTVTRRTKTQFEVDNKEGKFYIRNGERIGASIYNRGHFIPYDEELLNQHEKEKAERETRINLSQKLRCLDVDKLPIEKAEALYNLLKD